MARTRGAKDTAKDTRNTTEESGLTPFADALEQWLFDQSAKTRKRWSRRMLAEALDVSYGTVDGWFKSATSTRKAALPEPEAFWALVRVTGWEPETLRQLIGYDTLPPHVLGPWEFLREGIGTYPEWRNRPDMQAAVRAFLEFKYHEWRQKPKRPRTRRRKALTESSETPASRSDTSDAHTHTSATRREPVGAGK